MGLKSRGVLSDWHFAVASAVLLGECADSVESLYAALVNPSQNKNEDPSKSRRLDMARALSYGRR